MNDDRSWVPLRLFESRYRENLAVLVRRLPEVARQIDLAELNEIALHASNDRVDIADVVQTDDGTRMILPRPTRLSPQQAINALRQLEGLPGALPLLMAGCDVGWLWTFAAKLKTDRPDLPGYQSPLYLLDTSPATVKLAMHLHDWKDLLGDTRVQLFVGPNAMDQLHQQMTQHPSCSWPMTAISLDAGVWSRFKSIDQLRQSASDVCGKELESLMHCIAANPPVKSDRLKVLGLTSRYTSFLQHSMRDWLAAFEELGHATALLIEEHDHQVLTSLDQARAIARHNPDLVLMIDHYRAEFRHLPADRPTVCWVQDRMPHLFKTTAGDAQAAMDFAMGYARAELVGQFHWPGERFMSCVVPVNDKRFAVGSMSQVQLARYACDVSFVSHASKTPQEICDQELSLASDQATRDAIDAVSQGLMALYRRGEFVTGDGPVAALVRDSLRAIGSPVSDMTPLLDYARHRLNNALFRHQALEWASDICRKMGLRLALWGKGWERHPTLNQHAMGEADNQVDLRFIYHASKINLQLSPFTSAHQRSFEALCADGFLICRRTNRDAFDTVHKRLFELGKRLGIGCNDDLRLCNDPGIRDLINQSAKVFGVHPLDQPGDFWASLEAQADAHWTEAGSTLWPDQFENVSFSTRDDLAKLIARWVNDDAGRREVVRNMKQIVIDNVSYAAITRRLLAMLGL